MNKVLSTFFVVLFSFQAQTQESIEGIWLTEEGNSKVEIYQREDKYFGKIVWLDQSLDKNGSPVTDQKNPNKNLRNRKLLGIDMLKDLQYQNGKWYGKLYAPKRGLTTGVVILVQGEDKLKLNITYNGLSRQQIWTRAKL